MPLAEEPLPEEQMRAWVDYLRDLGVYDLYRRPRRAVRLPAEVLERCAAPKTAPAFTEPSAPAFTRPSAPAGGKSQQPSRSPTPAQKPPRPLTTVLPSAAQPTSPRPQGMPSPTQEPATLYFNADAGAGFSTLALPPELLAPMPKPKSFDELAPLAADPLPAAERAAALQAVRAEIGDCTRCPLAYAGRHTIVFADGNPNARLMFVGEGPGADEDASGLPFVGKAGQLLNNMIAAMGLQRSEVYIANIVKCRPPANRQPEFAEATTCSQFLLQQIDIVRPEVIVALGATAATYLLGVRQSLASLRGQWHRARGARVAVTYHPAFLLRDPRQKGEAWKDLQRVMAELKLTPSPRKS